MKFLTIIAGLLAAIVIMTRGDDPPPPLDIELVSCIDIGGGTNHCVFKLTGLDTNATYALQENYLGLEYNVWYNAEIFFPSTNTEIHTIFSPYGFGLFRLKQISAP